MVDSDRLDNRHDDKLDDWKIVMVGNSFVGKTQIADRYVNTTFSSEYYPSDQVQYFKTNTKVGKTEVSVNLHIFDPISIDNKSLTPILFRKTGAMLVYDITDEQSFIDMKRWYEEVHKSTDRQCVYILVGNKLDRDGERKVQESQGRAWAEENDFSFMEVSAKSGTHIHIAFAQLVAKMSAEHDYFDGIREQYKNKIIEFKQCKFGHDLTFLTKMPKHYTNEYSKCEQKHCEKRIIYSETGAYNCNKKGCMQDWCIECVEAEFKHRRDKSLIMITFVKKPHYLSFIGEQPASTKNNNATFKKWYQRPSGAWYQGMQVDGAPMGKGCLINTEYRSVIIGFFKEGIPVSDYTVFNLNGTTEEHCNE